MGDLLIRDVSDAMKLSLAERADKAGRSLSEEVKDLLEKAMGPGGADEQPQKNAWETLRAIYEPKTEEEVREAEMFVEIMEEIEAERKRDFGRPFEDFD